MYMSNIVVSLWVDNIGEANNGCPIADEEGNGSVVNGRITLRAYGGR